MSPPTEFSPDHLAGLAQLPVLVRLLEACTDGEVWNALTAIAGKKRRTPMWSNQLIHLNRFLYYVYPTPAWFVGLGFDMGTCRTDTFPTAQVILETSTGFPESTILMEAFETFRLANGAWSQWHVGTPWPGVEAHRSIRTFLAVDDQVEAVRRWFLERLAEVARLKADRPDLPWTAENGSSAGGPLPEETQEALREAFEQALTDRRRDPF